MKVLFGLFLFLWKLMIFFRQFFLFLVRNDRNWSSLLRCITLNARVYSLTLVSTSTANSKTPSISLTYPKFLIKTSSEEWLMMLHTTSNDFVILKHKQRRGNCKKSDKFRLPYGHTQPFQERNSRRNKKNNMAIGLFCWSILLKH